METGGEPTAVCEESKRTEESMAMVEKILMNKRRALLRERGERTGLGLGRPFSVMGAIEQVLKSRRSRS